MVYFDIKILISKCYLMFSLLRGREGGSEDVPPGRGGGQHPWAGLAVVR